MKRNLLLAAACTLALAFTIPVPARGDAEEEAKELVQKADRLAREKKYDEAIEAMRKAVELAPRNDQYLMILSEIERRAGRFADGVEHARKAIEINDKVGLYYTLVVANAYGNEDPELALRYCKKVLDMGPEVAGQGAYNDARLYEGLLKPKTYTITWDLDPARLNATTRASMRDQVDVALPKDGLPYQSVTVQVKGAANARVIKGEVNDVLRVLRQGEKPFQVITKVTCKPISYKKKLARPGRGSLPADARAALGPAETFDPASPKLQKVAAEVKGENSVATVRNVLAWMHKNIAYKLQNKSIVELDFKNVDEILDRGHAECRGYTMLFAALCRAAGVPARPLWGILILPREQGGFASHNWDEVYIAGCGWVPVDPQKPETFGWLPTTHVRMFMDLRKSATSKDNAPLHYLLFMNGEKLRYEESVAKD
jgi:transglutaminase-like putative cysteine protease